MKRKITRSGGIPIRMNGIPTGFIAGGGWSGCTKRLDALVEKAAIALAQAFRREIEIRFNSSRESGGAWLKNGREGLGSNSEVGIMIAERRGPGPGMTRERWEKLPEKQRMEILRKGRLIIHSYAKGKVLTHPGLATEGHGIDPDRKYSWRPHRSVEAARSWLVIHVDRAKLRREEHHGGQ